MPDCPACIPSAEPRQSAAVQRSIFLCCSQRCTDLTMVACKPDIASLDVISASARATALGQQHGRGCGFANVSSTSGRPCRLCLACQLLAMHLRLCRSCSSADQAAKSCTWAMIRDWAACPLGSLQPGEKGIVHTAQQHPVHQTILHSRLLEWCWIADDLTSVIISPRCRQHRR